MISNEKNAPIDLAELRKGLSWSVLLMHGIALSVVLLVQYEYETIVLLLRSTYYSLLLAREY